MYNDVVRVEEFEKLINCSSVQVRDKNQSLLIVLYSIWNAQNWCNRFWRIYIFNLKSYITNSHKVIFLNERSQTSNFRTANSCRYCDRSLPDQYIYCCISCKVQPICSLSFSFNFIYSILDFLPKFESFSIRWKNCWGVVLELPEN